MSNRVLLCLVLDILDNILFISRVSVSVCLFSEKQLQWHCLVTVTVTPHWQSIKDPHNVIMSSFPFYPAKRLWNWIRDC